MQPGKAHKRYNRLSPKQARGNQLAAAMSSSSSSYLPQPLVAYPQSTSTQPSSHSTGSFGPVFVVLAVITVVAVIACIVGRLCARRLCQPKTSPVGRAHAVRDVERGFGIDFPMAMSPMAKPAAMNAPFQDGKLRGHTSRIHQEIRGGRGGVKPHGHGVNFEARPSK